MRIVKSNESELEMLNSFIEDDRSFSSYVDWRGGHHKDFNDDVADMFNYINQKSPVIESPEEKPLFNEFLNQKHEDFVDMKQRATGKPILSYLATKSACKLYDEIIDNQLMKKAQDALNKAENERTDEESKAIKKAKNSMKLEVRKNIQKFKEEFDESEEALMTMAVCGSDPNSSPKELNAKTAMDFLKNMQKNPRVKEIMKLVGKFQNLARHKLMTTHDGVQSIVGVKMGNEISNLLPDELGLLVDVDFESLKSLQMLQKQLFQYKTRAKQPKTGGPFVVCVDESGSMEGLLNANSKAFLFGLWQVAKADKRDLVVVRFGGAGCEITHNVKTVDDMLMIAENFICSGSTDFETPLKKARQIIENGGQFEKADIVFITDDGGNISNSFLKEFNEFRKATKTKVVSLALVPDSQVMKQFSDQVVYGFEDLADITF